MVQHTLLMQNALFAQIEILVKRAILVGSARFSLALLVQSELLVQITVLLQEIF